MERITLEDVSTVLAGIATTVPMVGAFVSTYSTDMVACKAGMASAIFRTVIVFYATYAWYGTRSLVWGTTVKIFWATSILAVFTANQIDYLLLPWECLTTLVKSFYIAGGLVIMALWGVTGYLIGSTSDKRRQPLYWRSRLHRTVLKGATPLLAQSSAPNGSFNGL